MWFSKFAKRSYQTELMDDLSLASDALRQNLDELERINFFLGGNEVVIDAFKKLKKKGLLVQNQTYTVVDFGTGGGDVLRQAALWARKNRLNIRWIGIDANPFMIEYATEKAKNFPEIEFRLVDIFSENFQTQKFDLAICSLFCHHFEDESLVKMFAQMKNQTHIGFIINDLHRHFFAYHSIKWITWLLRGSYLVQNDAPLSVWRAFLKTELKDLLQKAQCFDSQIIWKWAFRWQVIFLHSV